MLEPIQRQQGLGGVVTAAYLRFRGKVTSHLPAFHLGLKAVGREKRRARDRSIRLVAFLDAMSATADCGLRELVRLQQSQLLMDRKLMVAAYQAVYRPSLTSCCHDRWCPRLSSRRRQK